jgi:hypothetical protein
MAIIGLSARSLGRTKMMTLVRSLIALVLVLNLASCGGDKAVSQEVSSGIRENPQLSKQFSEVSPPPAIWQLRSFLEGYQPQVTIVTPSSDEILQDNTVKVSFQVKDLPLFKDSKLGLGPHLKVILDNQAYTEIYDLNQPLVLSDLTPGTHTLRVFAERPWDESFKNEGAYAQTRFHVFTKTDDNNPDPSLPVLTYSRPAGVYGAEPILLDFYLKGAPLRGLVAKDNSKDQINDWRIRCTINGESFVLDRWQAVYLKGFKPGKNWVKLEFLDNQGNPVKNVFNSTVGLFTYEPKAKDTLSKIVRGELSAEQVQGIVDSTYTEKIPTVEATPKPQVEEKPTPETESPKKSQTSSKRPSAEPTSTELPITPEIIDPTEPEILESPTPTPIIPQPEQTKPKGFFNRFKRPTAEPTPTELPITPQILESPRPTPIIPQPEPTLEPEKLEPTQTQAPAPIIPQPEPTLEPEKVAPKFDGEKLKRYFQRRQPSTVEPSPIPTEESESIEAPGKGDKTDVTDILRDSQ